MFYDMPVGLVPGTAGLVPGLVAVSSPPDSVAIRRFSSSYHLFEAFNMCHFGCYVQKEKPNKMADVGRMSTQMYSKDRSL